MRAPRSAGKVSELRTSGNSEAALTPRPQRAEMIQVMRTLTHSTRRSTMKIPREYARSSGVDSAALNGEFAGRGGGGKGVNPLEPWQLPPQKVLRGVLVYSQIKPRLCTIVTHPQ